MNEFVLAMIVGLFSENYYRMELTSTKREMGALEFDRVVQAMNLYMPGF